VFGTYQTQCAAVAKAAPLAGTSDNIKIPLSKYNAITFFNDEITIEERLYTDSDECKGKSSPSYFKTTVKIKETVSSDVPAPLKRTDSFDVSKVEWLDPAEFTKIQPK